MMHTHTRRPAQDTKKGLVERFVMQTSTFFVLIGVVLAVARRSSGAAAGEQKARHAPSTAS